MTAAPASKIYMCLCVHVCIYIYIYVCVCVCVCVCITQPLSGTMAVERVPIGVSLSTSSVGVDDGSTRV